MNRQMLIGKTFGRLTVVDISPDSKRKVLCECQCGNTTEVDWTNLTRNEGGTRSCGCLRREAVRGAIKKRMKVIEESETNYSVLLRKEPQKRNKTGVTGVWYDEKHGVYEAYISVRGKKKLLGRYPSFEKAKAVREEAFSSYYEPLLAKRAMIVGK